MKLPEDNNALKLFDDLKLIHHETAEVIVRDCAKVCLSNAESAEKLGARLIAVAYRIDAADILARYGLVEKL